MQFRDVAIVGIGETKFGKFMDRSITDLAAEACISAIRDAGVDHKKIEVATGAYSCQADRSKGQYFALPEVIMREIGITRIPMFRAENGCSTGSVAFRDVWYRIATGEYDIGLVFGMEKMNASDSASIRGGISDHEAEGDMEMGLTAAGIYALMANRMMYQLGVSREDLARVVVKNRKFGSMNPYSQFPFPTTIGKVLSARMIADPLTLYMCCGRGDGAAAIVLMDATTARQYTTHPVYVVGNVLTTGTYSDTADYVSVDSDKRASAEIYEMAGIGPEDIDVAEVHDSFAPAELKHYYDLGFCKPADCVRMIRDGETDLGGRIPVNTSGGLLSKGHIIGATGISQIYELTKQLRGECGSRQVEGAKTALQHNSGGFVHTEWASCAMNILVL